VIILGNLSGLTPDKNPGKFHITGAEAIMDMVFAKDFTGFINFTVQKAWGKNLLTGRSGNLPGIARFKSNIGVTRHISDLFSFSVAGNWVGKRPVQSANPHGPVAGYFLTNFTLNTSRLFNNRVSASLMIHNLFNTHWLDPGFRTGDGIIYATVLEQPGINGLFKIALHW
jgi:hypothetical protein